MKPFLLHLFFMFFVASLFAQQTQTVDFLEIKAEVSPNASNRTVTGSMTVKFKVLQPTDSVYMDAVKMKLTYIPESELYISSTEKKIWFVANFQKDKIYTTGFSFKATPKKTLYFFPNEIWTQGQGKYTSHWLPSIDDMNDKIEFDLTLLAPEDKTVIANGKLLSVTPLSGIKRWHFDMQKPMSSYLVAMAIGIFKKKTIYSNSNIPISLYINREDSLKLEPTYRYTKEIFDFLETEIGVSYPWQNYKQVPVRDFLYAGMENTTLTLFSKAFVVDSVAFTDRNYVMVNAHEMAHQWFGNFVTETSSTNHWLHEGFATYYALLAQRKIFGDDFYYWKLYNSANQLQEMSNEGKGESLLNPKAGSLTFYEKGAWALHILRETVGDLIFKQAVKNYLIKHAYSNVTTRDFIIEVENLYGKPLTTFKENWLQQTAFKAEEVFKSLMKSPFMQDFFKLSALRNVKLSEKKEQLNKALESTNEYLGQEAVYQLALEPYEEVENLYKKAFKTNNVYIRQAIAFSLEKVPSSIQKEYEILLNDSSYLTQEVALYNLWFSFPEKQKEYLDKMKSVIGFQDKNVKQLWLALAINTPNYNNAAKELYKNELQNYTNPKYSFEIREKAMEYCYQLQLINKEVVLNITEGCIHPNWRFRNFSRNLLKKVLENETYKEILRQNTKELSKDALQYVANHLNF